MTRELNLESIREDYRIYLGQKGADAVAVRQATVRLADAVPALLARVEQLEAAQQRVLTLCENPGTGPLNSAKNLAFLVRRALEGTDD